MTGRSGRLLSFWELAYFQELLAVSFREGLLFCLFFSGKQRSNAGINILLVLNMSRHITFESVLFLLFKVEYVGFPDGTDTSSSWRDFFFGMLSLMQSGETAENNTITWMSFTI